MIFNTAIPTSGGGSSMGYRIDVNSDGSTIIADYNGSTLTEIATAWANDPVTDVTVVVRGASHDHPLCCHGLEYASYNESWGDLASTVRFIVFEYDQGDDRIYAYVYTLSGSGNRVSYLRVV